MNIRTAEASQPGWKVAGKALALAAIAIALVLSARSANFLDPHGLIFVLAGGVAMALIGYAGADIRRAFAHAARAPESDVCIGRSVAFWESAARNFWILGVLRSMLSFVAAVAEQMGGISGITMALARSLLAAFYGVVLAVACYVPYWKLSGTLRKKQQETPAGWPPETSTPGGKNGWFMTSLGYFILVAILISVFAKPSLPETWAILKWSVYWPSLLIVLGGTLALVLFVGDSPGAPSASMAFALTGLIGSLMGFIQVLFGFASLDIEAVAQAVTFVLSSCLTAMLGMLFVSIPLEDRLALPHAPWQPALSSRLAWYVFPLLALIFMVIMFVLVVTPITIPQRT